MLLANSLWRKVIATGIAAGGFVMLYEATILDSKYGTGLSSFIGPSDPLGPGSRLAFTATAYCKGFATTSGVPAQKGIAAADPQILPIGSIVQIESADGLYDGIYSVLDTGPLIRGREIDLYMWNCTQARIFGRKSVRMTVLRLGWDPKATARGFLDRFRSPAAASPLLPSRPLPVAP